MHGKRSIWDWLVKEAELFDVLIDGSTEEAIEALKRIKAKAEAENAEAKEAEEALRKRLRDGS